MTSSIQELCDRLEETILLLDGVHASFWADWLRRDLKLIRNDNFDGIDHLREAFGGMGSFNDLLLHTANGHTIDESNSNELNDQLDLLRSQIYELVEENRYRYLGENKH
jgi:hypothetical protein